VYTVSVTVWCSWLSGRGERKGEERHLCVPALDCQRGAVDELVLAECRDDRLVGKAQVQSPSPSLQRFTGSARVAQRLEHLLRGAGIERGLDLLVGVGGTAAEASAADVDVEDLAGTVDPHPPHQRLADLAGNRLAAPSLSDGGCSGDLASGR